jgi:hypothetical protein
VDHGSIHWRRRWFYALWAVLLGTALGAYALWSIPGKKGTARLVVAMRLEDSAGLSTEMASYPPNGSPWDWKAMEFKGGRFVGEIMVPLAYRRWTGAVHHGRCHEGVLLRFTKGGERRYFLIDLRQDVATGLFMPGRKMALEYNGLAWGRMDKDIPRLSRLP